jgi:hypothetical protein
MTFRRRGARQLTGSTAAPVIFPSSSRFTFRIFSVASIPLHDAIEEYVAIRKRKRVTEKKVTEIVDELRETGRAARAGIEPGARRRADQVAPVTRGRECASSCLGEFFLPTVERPAKTSGRRKNNKPVPFVAKEQEYA